MSPAETNINATTFSRWQEWREKARAVQQGANSRRGVVRAQALIRGYLARSGSSAPRFLPNNQDPDEDG